MLYSFTKMTESATSEISIDVDPTRLFISQNDERKVTFEEILQLLNSEDQVIDEVTVAVEESNQSNDMLSVYQYSQEESRVLRVQSEVYRTLETNSEVRKIRKQEKTTLLRITDLGNGYRVFLLIIEGKYGWRDKLDVPKSSDKVLYLEGSNIVLLRIIAVNRILGKFRGHTINHQGALCEVEYLVEGRKHGQVKVRRTVTDALSGDQEVMTTLLSKTGRILKHQWSSSTWYLMSSYLQQRVSSEDTQSVEVPTSEPELKADKDAYFKEKESIIQMLGLYLKDHCDVQDMIADFLKETLFEKPDDVLDFADQYFSEFVGTSRVSEEIEIRSKTTPNEVRENISLQEQKESGTQVTDTGTYDMMSTRNTYFT